MTIEFPTNLSDRGFKTDDISETEIIYHDSAKATGAVIVVTVNKTAPEKIEVACRELRRFSMEGYAKEASEPQFDRNKNACYFSKSGEMDGVPISGKTTIRTDCQHPKYTIIVSGLWPKKYDEALLSIFDKFSDGIIVRLR